MRLKKTEDLPAFDQPFREWILGTLASGGHRNRLNMVCQRADRTFFAGEPIGAENDVEGVDAVDAAGFGCVHPEVVVA